MASNLKTAGRKAKQTEFGTRGVVAICIWDTFDLLVFKANLRSLTFLVLKVILGSFRALVSKMASNSKMADRTAIWGEIWDSGVVAKCIWGTFDLLVFNGIWGSFGALVSGWSVPRKRLSIKRNGMNFGTRG